MALFKTCNTEKIIVLKSLLLARKALRNKADIYTHIKKVLAQQQQQKTNSQSINA